jgi:hypothetical protein
MIPAKPLLFLIGALLTLAAADCARHSTLLPARLGPAKTIRTAEEIRLYQGPLSITVDTELGYGNLGIPQAEQESFSLFIAPEDLPKLDKLDKTQPYEVRYWYYEESWGSGTRFRRGELVSIRNASGTVLDRSRCALHNLDMARRPVPITYGLPMREFVEAMKCDFPNPAFMLGGCVITDDSRKEAPHYVCAKCDAAAEAWSASFVADPK